MIEAKTGIRKKKSVKTVMTDCSKPCSSFHRYTLDICIHC